MARKQGTSMGGIQKSPARRKREEERRRREEAEWAAKCGPVTVYRREDSPADSPGDERAA